MFSSVVAVRTIITGAPLFTHSTKVATKAEGEAEASANPPRLGTPDDRSDVSSCAHVHGARRRVRAERPTWTIAAASNVPGIRDVSRSAFLTGQPGIPGDSMAVPREERAASADGCRPSVRVHRRGGTLASGPPPGRDAASVPGTRETRPRDERAAEETSRGRGRDGGRCSARSPIGQGRRASRGAM